ncbi:MAG: class I SAM-dependent methyltransferase [Candidatus Aenigmarchaeota archaeon]|nr:class I SAM-dependent methyltransferase [Candidatus Aenigmarchaeota archaeon]
MEKENKNESISFWSKHAKKWEDMAYNKNNDHLNFPISQQRQDITISEIQNLCQNKNMSIVDFGCADGKLVMGLIKNGYFNVKGIDNSKEMIDVAKNRLEEENPDINVNNIFFNDDVDTYDENNKADVITAMGLIEYLLNIDDFFRKLKNMLNDGGYAFIESRNKLFNLFSANEFTCKSNIAELVEELKDIDRFSPINDKEKIKEIIRNIIVKYGANLEQIKSNEKSEEKEKFEKYPFNLPQYTPKDIEHFCKNNGLKLKYVIYYHPHPFRPVLEHCIPQLFNSLALHMEPLGYTPIGSTICSSFIAVIQKI